jgi:trehalose 6-phosphate phosphatase
VKNDILSPRGRPALERLAASRALLAFDYDGVLAPVVPQLGGSPMSASTRRLLRAVAARWPSAVISGRGYAHLRHLTRGTVQIAVGNHGYELGRLRPVSQAVRARLRRWRLQMEETLAAFPGVEVEDKRSTLSVHYGLVPGAAVERAVLAAAAELKGVRLVRGKRLVNVIPAGFPHKGDAVLALLRKLRLDTALFVGDDVTDEDAFAIGLPRVLGVRVGPGRSAAPWRLEGQDQVEALLEILAGLRPPARRRQTR